MNIIQKLNHHIQFIQPNPLDNGLLEEIKIERSEPDAINLSDNIDSEMLDSTWESILDQSHSDPEWTNLGQDE